MSEEHCICCGAIVPKDAWACPNCLVAIRKIAEEGSNKDDDKTKQ